GFENIDLVENRSAENFAEAFRSARSQEADFFILITYRETERSFQVISEVYNARTGSRVDNFRSIRTGNNRVTQSLVRIADGLAEALPFRGSIYRRSGNDVLVDIGEFQNVSEEQTLLVIRDEHLSLVNNSFKLEYDEENLLGEIEINAVDDLIARGEVRPYHFFDLINPGDTVFPTPEDTEEEPNQADESEEEGIILSDIYNAILDID
ncbi:MAG: hypothetical protein ACP5IA_09470, partial [Sediminispirochaetaceae bacterium]